MFLYVNHSSNDSLTHWPVPPEPQPVHQTQHDCRKTKYHDMDYVSQDNSAVERGQSYLDN